MTTKSIIITVILVCVVLFAGVIALCAGGFYMGFRAMDTEISPKVDAIFAAIDNDTLGETYESDTTSEFKRVTTRAQYEEIGKLVKSKLGSLQSKSRQNFNLRQLNADTLASVTYAAQFEKGTGTIQVEFKKIGGQWRLVKIHINSPELLKEQATKACPNCGKPAPVSAKFCPHCGKPLIEPEKSDSQPIE